MSRAVMVPSGSVTACQAVSAGPPFCFANAADATTRSWCSPASLARRDAAYQIPGSTTLRTRWR